MLDADAQLNDDVPPAYRGLDRVAARKGWSRTWRRSASSRRSRPHPYGAAWRPLRCGDRALAFRPVVLRRAKLAEPAIKAVETGRTVFVPELGEHLLRVDAQHPALEHLAPALVGPSDPRVVRTRRHDLRGGDRSRGAGGRGEALRQADRAAARSRRARHLVLLGAVAVLDPGLAGGDEGARALLSRRRAGDGLRHHLLLGRADDDDGPLLHGGGAVPHGLHPRARARRARPEDVEVQGQYHRSPGPDRALRLRRPALHPDRAGGPRPRHQALGNPRRGLSQFRHQALERRALRRDERVQAGAGLRSRPVRAMRQPLDRGRIAETGARVGSALDEYKFNEAAGALYQFAWGNYCDWYLEFSKPILGGRCRSRTRRQKRRRAHGGMGAGPVRISSTRSCPSSPRRCGSISRAARSADHGALAPLHPGHGGRHRHGRSRLGDRAGLADPGLALGDECSPGSADPSGGARAQPHRQGTSPGAWRS